MLFAALLAALSALASDDSITIRVLHQNVYGRNAANCAERHLTLARKILEADPPFDVVSLNEHWSVPFANPISCPARHLRDAILQDARYRDAPGVTRSKRHYPRANVALTVSGGLAIFTPHEIVEHRDWAFGNSNLIPLSGYMLSRVKLPNGVQLDVWTTHLQAASDRCDDGCRGEEISELASAVAREAGERPTLILGDFNTGGPVAIDEKPPYAGNGGYDRILAALRGSRDLWLEAFPFRVPGVNPFTVDCVTNRLNGDCAYRERIDYAFVPAGGRVKLLSIAPVHWETRDGTPVSDHYGLDIKLRLQRTPNPPRQSPRF
jgi:endonuclease/exonuclease/phosphatase family metal-dependent hydrolase